MRAGFLVFPRQNLNSNVNGTRNYLSPKCFSSFSVQQNFIPLNFFFFCSSIFTFGFKKIYQGLKLWLKDTFAANILIKKQTIELGIVSYKLDIVEFRHYIVEF